MSGFVDIHSHFVYGIDDGAANKAEMEAMLDTACADGTAILYATPHVTPGIAPFDGALFLQHLEEARAYCRTKGYPLTIHAGAEILYTPAANRFISDKQLYTLADSAHVLVEFVPDISFAEMEDAVSLFERAGYIPIIAHAERYNCLFQHRNAKYLKEHHDVRLQMNCNTILKKQCLFRKIATKDWLRSGLISFLASDAHDAHIRPFKMKDAYAALCSLIGDEQANDMMKNTSIPG